MSIASKIMIPWNPHPGLAKTKVLGFAVFWFLVFVVFLVVFLVFALVFEGEKPGENPVLGTQHQIKNRF
jgi:hypothetical protein